MHSTLKEHIYFCQINYSGCISLSIVVHLRKIIFENKASLHYKHYMFEQDGILASGNLMIIYISSHVFFPQILLIILTLDSIYFEGFMNI